MKKALLVFMAVLGFAFAATAQNGAIGVRLGGGSALYGAEVSYQMPVGHNRIELDLGFCGNEYINLAGVYQWAGPIAGNFGWYVGPGVNLGFCLHHGFGIAAILQGGVEYDFSSIPLQLTLDARPSWDFIRREGCVSSGFGWGIALGIRYML
jgi:hypothetical protein